MILSKLDLKVRTDPGFGWNMLWEEAIHLGKIRSAELYGHHLVFAIISTKDNYSPAIKTAIRSAGGSRYDEKSFIFVDNLPEFMVNQTALHEHFHNRFEWGLDHLAACMEELLLTKQDVGQYEKAAEYLVAKTKSEKRTQISEDIWDYWYFGDIIPNFHEILREGRLEPTEILDLYLTKLQERFGQFKAPCSCHNV